MVTQCRYTPCPTLLPATSGHTSSLRAMSVTWTSGLLLSVISYCTSLGDECVLGIVGESAILPCVYSGAEELASVDISIEWRLGSDVVHRSESGEGSERTQIMSYSNRTRLSAAALQTGDFSLQLSDVIREDEQSYDCYISHPGLESSTPICTVCLRVAAHFSSPVLLNEVREGEEARFTCHSSGGFPEPAVHWFLDQTEQHALDSAHTQSTLIPDSGLYDVTSVLLVNVTQDTTVSCAIENLLLNETLESLSYGVEASPVVGRASQAMWMFSTTLCVLVAVLVASAVVYQIKEDYDRKRNSNLHQVVLEEDETKHSMLDMERLDSLTETNV
ncbi:ICOS ligand-like isoform X2 [Megalops cyprinoides]|uniref:ICOS ligand-like isoform X2 n=1 Tax=Megalops cyprinoides TaxID=118141 RepID=UPI001863CF66|nr:ICOS ligand-like isoform X2 [Megalops cyprinoides]